MHFFLNPSWPKPPLSKRSTAEATVRAESLKAASSRLFRVNWGLILPSLSLSEAISSELSVSAKMAIWSKLVNWMILLKIALDNGNPNCGGNWWWNQGTSLLPDIKYIFVGEPFGCMFAKFPRIVLKGLNFGFCQYINPLMMSLYIPSCQSVGFNPKSVASRIHMIPFGNAPSWPSLWKYLLAIDQES